MTDAREETTFDEVVRRIREGTFYDDYDWASGPALRALDRASPTAIVDYIERLTLRIEAGPAMKEHAFPVNQIRYTAEEIHAIKRFARTLCDAISSGMCEPEPDWPVNATPRP